MGSYARVEPGFWTGDTGRSIRAAGRDAQVIALYLLTGPTSNPLGLYYLPLPTLCHEVGIKPEGALKALRRLSEGGFAHYDGASEVVFVPEMARYQVAESMKPGDKRHKWIVREAENLRKLTYFGAWYERYKEVFRLPEMEGLGRGLDAPSMPTPTPTATATLGKRPTKLPSRRCPADWQPDAEDTARIVAECRLDETTVARRLGSFRDHEFKTPRSDWDAAWRNWLRDSNGYDRPRHGTRPTQATGPGGVVC